MTQLRFVKDIAKHFELCHMRTRTSKITGKLTVSSKACGVSNTENSRVMCNWCFVRGFLSHSHGFSKQSASNVENELISWYNHVKLLKGRHSTWIDLMLNWLYFLHICQTNAIPKRNTTQQYLQKYINISDTCHYLDLLVVGLVQAGINTC